MKKTTLFTALALLCLTARAQEILYNNPLCGLDYSGVNTTDDQSFDEFIEKEIGIYHFNVKSYPEDKFDYENSNILAASQCNMHTFDEIDLSLMDSVATRTLLQTAIYQSIIRTSNQYLVAATEAPRWLILQNAYDSAFFDNLEPPVIKKQRRNGIKTLLNRRAFIKSLERKWLDEKMLLFFQEYRGDSVKCNDMVLEYFKGDSTRLIDSSRKAIIERAWWQDDQTRQFESWTVSLQLPAFDTAGAPIYIYIIFDNYFTMGSEYTSINGISVPINYMFNEDLLPHAISEMMPDTFYIRDNWDSHAGSKKNVPAKDFNKKERARGIEAFQPGYQISEFMLLQRRLAIFGKGSDTLAEKRFRYETDKKGKIQGKVTKLYRDGKTLFTAEFKDGKPNGEYVCLYPDGTERERGGFADGFMHGKWVSRYEDGQVETERFYSMGRKDSAYRTFHRNGSPSETYLFRKDGTKSLERRYSDGQLMEKGEIDHNNKAQGIWEYRIKFSEKFAAEILDTFDLWDRSAGFINGDCRLDKEKRSMLLKVAYESDYLTEDWTSMRDYWETIESYMTYSRCKHNTLKTPKSTSEIKYEIIPW